MRLRIPSENKMNTKNFLNDMDNKADDFEYLLKLNSTLKHLGSITDIVKGIIIYLIQDTPPKEKKYKRTLNRKL
jgi:hypothetical protein